MWNQLEGIELRFEEVREELTKPEILSDMALTRTLSKEYKDLEAIVSVIQKFRNVDANLTNAKQMQYEESDPEMLDIIRDEIVTLTQQHADLELELKLLIVPSDPEDKNNVIIEIRAGTGGDEAAIFAGDLARMYQRYAARKGWIFEINDYQEGSAGGYKEIITTMRGQDAFGIMKYESGVHRVQRVPATESQGRIHTSAATVAAMPEMDDEVTIEINDADLRIDTYRASGAGGQHVNKTESAVRITHLPTGLVVTNQDEKSQPKNRAKAMRILQSRLYDMELQKRLDEQAKLRKTFVSTGDRSAKIRTYNFPQGRVTEHRINLTIYNLAAVMEGELDQILDPLRMAENAEKLKMGSV